MRSAGLAALLLAPALGAQDRVDFERHVLPILEARCIDCHGAPATDARGRPRQPKAGLRLDGRAWIERGSDDNPVLAPGAPEDSLLYALAALPDGDDFKMPARGEPLSPDELETLRRWIADGADFGGWTGAPGPGPSHPGPEPARLPARVAVLRALAEGLPPPAPARIARAREASFHIVPVEDGSPLLRVTVYGREDAVTAQSLAALAPIAEHVAFLSLARTALGDAELRPLAELRRVIHLDLHESEVGDGALASLAELPELRVLNLHGTKVTDEGLRELARLPRLERLYLWGSAVTDAGVERLRSALPEARIHHRLTLPD